MSIKCTLTLLYNKNPAKKRILRDLSWSHLESNQAPTDYESVALTEWAIGPFMRLRNYYNFTFDANKLEIDFYIFVFIWHIKMEGFVILNEVPKKGADNKLVAFLHPKSTTGVLIELCQEIK